MTKLNFTKGYVIPEPKKDTVIPVPLRTWNSLKEEIKNLNSKESLLMSVPSLALGTSLSAFVTWFTISEEKTKNIILVLGISSFGIGVLSHLFCDYISKTQRANAQNVINRMNDIDSGYDLQESKCS